MASAGPEPWCEAFFPRKKCKAVGLDARMKFGHLADLEAGKFRVILGSALAAELDVKQGQTVVLITPEGSFTPAGFQPRMKKFTVSGIFESGMYEFDRGLALTHMADAAMLYRMGDRVTGLRLALEDPFLAPLMVRTVARAIDYDGNGYFVNDWTHDHENFFRSIELTKSMMFFILLILVVVAAINLVATLVMIVKEKQTDIAILRTIGAAPDNVLRIFLVQGALIGLVGTFAGACLGWVLALNVTVDHPRDRRCVRYKVPGCECLPHERSAFRSAPRRRVAGVGRGAGACGAGHYLPRVARRAHAASGGPSP